MLSAVSLCLLLTILFKMRAMLNTPVVLLTRDAVRITPTMVTPPATVALDPHQNVIVYDLKYATAGLNAARDVFVVPRRAYYYSGAPSEPRNTILILAEVHYDAVNSILACELDGHVSMSIQTIKDGHFADWVWRNEPRYIYTHRILLVVCLGYPIELISSGSITKLIYRKEGDEYYSRVETEKPLLVTYDGKNSTTPTQGKGSIVACTIAYGHPEYLNDWLKYQAWTRCT